MTCDTRHFHQLGALGRLRVRQLQLHTLLSHPHIWAAGMSHGTQLSRHTLTQNVACDGHGSVKERNVTRHWPTGA